METATARAAALTRVGKQQSRQTREGEKLVHEERVSAKFVDGDVRGAGRGLLRWAKRQRIGLRQTVFNDSTYRLQRILRYFTDVFLRCRGQREF